MQGSGKMAFRNEEAPGSRRQRATATQGQTLTQDRTQNLEREPARTDQGSDPPGTEDEATTMETAPSQESYHSIYLSIHREN